MVASCSFATSAAALGPNVIPGQYIVVYDESAESVRAETDARERALGFESELRYRHALRGFAGELTPAQVRALQTDPEVAYVAPDRTVQAAAQVSLASGEMLPPTGTRRIQAATTSTAEQPSGVGVAVLDSGVDLDHPDLNVLDGTDCVTPTTTAEDDNGHGTHVAGSIAAENNGAGRVGVAPGTTIWAVKVLDSNGDGSFANIICGIDWVTANTAARNIKVLNMSLSGGGPPVGMCASTTDPLHQAVCRATAADVLNVVSAGNAGRAFDVARTAPPTPQEVPAAYPEVLTVTALSDTDGASGGAGGSACGQSDDQAATFSNFAATSGGAAHTIAAPGVCITSTWLNGGYNTISGTSMASPHMAGVAALCESHGGGAGPCAGKAPAEVITMLRAQAEAYTQLNPSYGFASDPLRAPGFPYYGYLTRADTQPPTTTITSGQAGSTSSASASFSFSTNEAGSTFECQLDAGAWAPCSSPHEVTGLADGAHTFSVRSIDIAGNVEPAPPTQNWVVDTTAPETALPSGPPRFTGLRSGSFAFTASEDGSRFECMLDGGAWAACTSPTVLRQLRTGKHTFEVRAIDAVGNVDLSAATHTWKVLPSLRRIRSQLDADAGALAASLRRSGIGELVERRGFRAKRMDALVAGRFTVLVSGRIQGDEAGVARKRVLAKGSRRVRRSGRYAFRVKLTRRARQALRDDRRARLTVTVRFRDRIDRVAKRGKTVTVRR